MLKSVAGVIDVSIDNTPYQPAADTTAQAVINADGSGSFTFTNLEEGEQGNSPPRHSTAPKGVISGSFTWDLATTGLPRSSPPWTLIQSRDSSSGVRA